MDLVLSICGICFIVVGLMMYFFPPKKINSWYGYRTGRSMANQDIWNFSKKYGAKALVVLGDVFIMIDLIFLTLFLKYEWILDDLFLPVLIISVFAMVGIIEKRLERFEKNKEE